MQLLKPSWVNHDGDKAIFSVDIHPSGHKFATGGQGQDSSGRVVIWNLKPVVSEKAEHDEKIPKLLCQLDQHLGCVNSVRWSQSGKFLASGGDDKVIIIWQQSGYGGGSVFGSNVVNVESWRIVSTLRGHQGDILDVSWSPDDTLLASASIDNTVIIWNANKWPEQIRVLKGHTGMVKGVTWDPVGRYLASQADDKSLRIWRTSNWESEQKIIDPFTDCEGTTTVLRPSWSPDGQYLVSAHAMNNGGPTAQIIERDGWNTDKDFVGHRKAITCVRFNPNILKTQDQKQSKHVQYCCVAIGSRDRSISIWFTSLKRPLVVIQDIFEDSVLDLSWSQCGKYLMAVSKDGSLAFIQFSSAEIGRPLLLDETIALHVKLYGNSAMSSTKTESTIIENPELLKLQEEEEKREKFQPKTVEEKKVSTPMGPTNKQIEMRTADGRRRITPMFIPPSAEGETNATSLEPNFSSSRQEKSKIIIEKVDGIVEPNVTSPNKNSSKSSLSADQNSLMEANVSQTAFETLPPGLSARIQGGAGAISTEKLSASPIAVKRKIEDVTGPVKKKRGRPRLYAYERLEPTTSTVQSGSPTVEQQRTAPLSKDVPVVGQVLPKKHLLDVASMSRTSRLQIPGTENVDGSSPVLVIENDWRKSEKISASVTGSLPSLHRVTRCDNGDNIWTMYLTSEAKAAVATTVGAAIACLDCSLHLININNGEHLLPPIQLQGKPSHLSVQDFYLIILTTDATLSIWDFANRKKLIVESIRHLVEERSAVKCVQLLGTSESLSPVVVLKTGEAFSWFKDLETWVQLGEEAGIRRFVSTEYCILRPSLLTAQPNSLTGMLMQSASYTGSSRLGFSSAISGEVKQGLTESFLRRMITSSEHLCSSVDFKFWFKRLTKLYISEGMEKSLRRLFDDLLGPTHSGSFNSTNGSSWSPKIVNIDKRQLLEELLKEILLADNSIKFQRLHSEYQDQLKGLSIDSI